MGTKEKKKRGRKTAFRALPNRVRVVGILEEAHSREQALLQKRHTSNRQHCLSNAVHQFSQIRIGFFLKMFTVKIIKYKKTYIELYNTVKKMKYENPHDKFKMYKINSVVKFIIKFELFSNLICHLIFRE